MLAVLARVEAPVRSEVVDRDHRPVEDNVGVPRPFRVPNLRLPSSLQLGNLVHVPPRRRPADPGQSHELGGRSRARAVARRRRVSGLAGEPHPSWSWPKPVQPPTRGSISAATYHAARRRAGGRLIPTAPPMTPTSPGPYPRSGGGVGPRSRRGTGPAEPGAHAAAWKGELLP
jgi:hypothetical protein